MEMETQGVVSDAFRAYKTLKAEADAMGRDIIELVRLVLEILKLIRGIN